MPDKRRREPTAEELDREAEITPADIDRAKEFADEVAPPLLRRLLNARAVDGPRSDQR
jgi:hypothetical protein